MPAVSVHNVRKTFAGDIQALADVDFEARHGEITALIGANGSGKSTLLKILFGLVRVDSGSVRTLDLDPVDRNPVLHRKIGYVSQHPALDPEMTGAETLALFYALYGLSPAKQGPRLEALAEDFELTPLLDRPISTYSGGFRQRLHIALGLLHHPRLLLLDEPTAGLDQQGQAFLWATLRAYAEGRAALVLATHDLEEVSRHCDQVVLLSDGGICAQDTPRAVIAEYGRTVLRASVDKPPKDWQAVQQRLKTLKGISKVSWHNRQIVVWFTAAANTDAKILTALTEMKINVVAFQREQANLASAYFWRTGRNIIKEPPNRHANRAERRR